MAAVTQDWEEGIGLDLEGYKDKVLGQIGSDWVQRKKGSNWTNPGGTYREQSDYLYTTHFSGGLENLEVNITPLVERWLAGDQTNYGVNIRLSASYEASASETYVASDSSVVLNSKGARDSYFTKRFFGRGTQYFFKRPVIEARWNSSIKDDRANVYFSSSSAPANDNLNKIYFYNIVRGRLVNLPGIPAGGDVCVSLFSGSSDNTGPPDPQYFYTTQLLQRWSSQAAGSRLEYIHAQFALQNLIILILYMMFGLVALIRSLQPKLLIDNILQVL